MASPSQSATSIVVSDNGFSVKKINILLNDLNYLLWRHQGVLPHLIGMDSSAQIWNALANHYDNLASCGELISDHEHVTVILNNLSPEYESIITVITTSQLPYSVHCVRTMLLDAESRKQVLVVDVPMSANFVTHQQVAINVNNIEPLAYPPSSTTRVLRGRGRSSRI
ncbi:hypothetical protein PVK06_027616 [Gossypium arboreum]|uniref:Uncharacterized protein n=1 Tax=Gossypium arboreum TaxID=29729 RepID=A0ABR0P3P7_GOSAR|nr:hypothetical protein PVK06_027616 [Gossypium arboreum]